MTVSVNLESIKYNLSALKNYLKGKTKICAMVKANAYGHGLVRVARAIESGVDYFGVAVDLEANELRQAGVNKPILIVGALNGANIKFLFEKNITQTVYSVGCVKELEHFGGILDKTVRVHLKLDTGMNRLGVKDENELGAVLDALAHSPHVRLEGVFTHFSAGGTDADGLRRQHNLFLRRLQQLNRFGGSGGAVGGFGGTGFGGTDGDFSGGTGACGGMPRGGLIVHCLSSGGILNAPDYAYDMVRPGIVLYGYNPDGLNKLDLRPALSVTAQIVSIKNIAAGEGVSYGASYVARGDKKIATVLAGYGDGYKRALSNTGRVLICGRFCKILGSVCMDMFMADISAVNAQILTPVILLGRDGQNAVTASDIATDCGTICYDVLTGFKARTPIEYV